MTYVKKKNVVFINYFNYHVDQKKKLSNNLVLMQKNEKAHVLIIYGQTQLMYSA